MADKNNLNKLTGIRRKEDFRLDGAHVEDPFNLSQLQDEIEKYSSITENITVKAFEPNKLHVKDKRKSNNIFQNYTMSADEVKIVYKSLINELAVKNNALMNQLEEIRLHEVYDEIGLLEKGTLPVQINDFSIERNKEVAIVFEKKTEFSDLMELARLVATREYVIRRRESTSFLSTFYSTHSFGHDISQYLHTYWPNVSLDVYTRSNVGMPSIIVKNCTQIHSMPLRAGTKLSIWIFARCCIGKIDPDLEPYSCLATTVRRYGMILPLRGSEARCKKCWSGADRLKFSRKSIETMKQEKSEDEDPLGTFGEDQFYLYITRFANKLKVGRARMARGVSRLLEQSCFDAIAFYPILSYANADSFEERVRKILKEQLGKLEQFGIEKVYGKAYTSDKLETIRQWQTGALKSNEELYQAIIHLLDNSELSRMLQLTNSKYVNLSDNWVFDSDVKLSNDAKEISYPFTMIEGYVRGIVGSLIFLDKGDFLDLEKLDGCLYRGGGFS
jgi:hypothetical protein